MLDEELAWKVYQYSCSSDWLLKVGILVSLSAMGNISFGPIKMDI